MDSDQETKEKKERKHIAFVERIVEDFIYLKVEEANAFVLSEAGLSRVTD